ncbi:MAG: erythromycin esterase family protein [Phycisphaerales bacterium]
MLTLLLVASVLAQPPGPPAQPPAADPPPLASDDTAWLAANAVRIRSIDPRERDFADLRPLKTFIGEARIVQLGEQSHGDGACFLAKCRLVEFLHQEMGFDVLVWESGLFDCRLADKGLRDPAIPIDDAWRNGIFGIWCLSAQVQPVLQYIRAAAATERPLEVAGYDCQFSSGKVERWVDAMAKHMAPLGESHPSARVLEALRRDAQRLQDDKAPIETLRGLKQGLENLAGLADGSRAKLIESHGEPEAIFMRRTIDDARTTLAMTLATATHKGGAYAGGHLNARDQRMGENLIWLANERYKGRKLIVWAATMHEVHDVQAIRPQQNPDMYKNAVTAGTVAKKALGDAMYTIAFDAHEGEAATAFRPQAFPIEPSPTESLGDHLSKLGHPFLYVDLKTAPAWHWLRAEFVMRPLGYMPMNAVWSRQVDGVFFTHTMFRSTRQGLAPEKAVLTVPDTR